MTDKDAFDMYHTCRWCRYSQYDNGSCYCTNRIISGAVFRDYDVYSVAEDGGLSAVIEETLNSNKPDKLLKELDILLLSWKTSKAKRAEVKKLFDEMLSEYFDFTLKEKLDEAISRLYQDRLDNDFTGEAEIADPDNFYCSRWE